MSATHKIVNGQSIPLTQAEIDAIETEWNNNLPGSGSQWLADQIAKLIQLRNSAKEIYADLNNTMNEQSLAMRGLALVSLDEFNDLRQWNMLLKGGIEASTSLADFKTRLGPSGSHELYNLPNRTAGQIKPAIRNKIGSGNAD